MFAMINASTSVADPKNEAPLSELGVDAHDELPPLQDFSHSMCSAGQPSAASLECPSMAGVNCLRAHVINVRTYKKDWFANTLQRSLILSYTLAVILRRTAPIKALLLDQTVLAGVGNWIADEVRQSSCTQNRVEAQ